MNLKEKISKILLKNEENIYTTIAIQLNFKSVDYPAPMMVDDKFLYYNEKYFENASDLCIESVMKHELLHVMLKHYERAKSIPDLNHDIANIAMDFAVNSFLKKNEIKTIEKEIGKLLIPTDYGFPLKNSFEFYYYELIKDDNSETMNKIKNDLEQSGNKVSKGGMGNLKNLVQFDEMDETEDSDEESKKLSEELSKKMTSKIQKACHHILDGDINSYENMRYTLENSYDRLKYAGKYAGDIEKIINANYEYHEVYNFKNKLKRVICNYMNSMEKDKTYKIPNKTVFLNDRRMILKGKKKLNSYKIATIIDISGSMSSEELESIMSYIMSILKSNINNITMDIIFIDTEISNIMKNAKPNQLKEVQIHGGGGTELNPAFEYCKENNYSGIFIFTDGYFWEKIENPYIPCFFIVGNEDEKIECEKNLNNWTWKNSSITMTCEESPCL